MRWLPETVWQQSMTQYLQREKAPLTAQEWAQVDAAVRDAHSQNAICRRFLPVQAPVSPAIEVAPTLTGLAGGDRSRGRSPSPWRRSGADQGLELPIIHSDFALPPPGPGFLPALLEAAAGAAQIGALAEDHLVLNGHPALEQPGLLTAPRRGIRPLPDWLRPGQAVAGVQAALADLGAQGYRGPCALVLNPDHARAAQESGVAMELADLCAAGVYVTPMMAGQQALLVCPVPEAMDLAVAQDLVTAFRPDPGGGGFRVFSLLTLRLRDPGAICTLEARGGINRH